MSQVIAYAPGFEHDIFVSYSSRDDIVESPQPGRTGRVSSLADLLSKRLTRMLGDHSLWIDRGRLDGQFLLTPAIEKSLQKTAIMIAVLSQGYHESKWCPWERDVFLREGLTFKNGASRVFVVEFDPIDDSLRPKDFSDHKAYRFWSKGLLEPVARILDPYNPAHEADYCSKLDTLASAIVANLRSLVKDPQYSPAARARIYLAETSDDLEEAWWKVKQYLEGQNIIVVPTDLLPRSKDQFETAVKANLAGVDLFVQLLSLAPGRKLSDTQTYAGHQHAAAAAAGLPILQWRDATLKEAAINTVELPVHRQLLDGPTVQAVKFGEFTQNILSTLDRQREAREREQRLQQKAAEKAKEAEEANSNGKSIFIMAHQRDSEIARDVETFLATQGFIGGLPITLTSKDQDKITPKEIREDIEANYKLADGTLVVYGRTPSLWFKNQMIEIGKVRRRIPRRCELGLLVAPPPKSFASEEGTHCIPVEASIDEKAFRPFLNAVANAKPFEEVLASQ